MAEKRRARPLLGTFVEIAVAGETREADRATDAGFEAIETMHRLASFQDPESELSKLNRAGGAEMEVDPLLARVLRLAAAMTRASDGLFNATLGGALVLRGVLPDHGFGDVAPFGSADDIEVKGNRARLKNNILVSLDGIAKGFAVDLAIKAMKREGVAAGWINAGGDLRVFGDMDIPVHRRDEDGRTIQIGRLRDGAIATSEISTEANPRFPGCIMEAGYGTPQPGVWSVVASTAWRADSLTKVAALAPETRRAEIITSLQGCLA
jgi:thiamine biosynthesis lipoprotein